ncbi:MAG TPA: ABATE domain-containing protein [Solirubrobacterales bacterium]|nr:ABATE domain-containing protein [Solirubrobacterales bacterium]
MERFGPTRRGGPLFRWLGEPLAIDLANTVMVVREGESVDLLDSDEALETWLELERPRLGDCRFALWDRAELLAAREDVRSLFTARATGGPFERAAVERLNAASRGAPVAPQLRLTAGGDCQVIAEERIADMPALLAAIARSAIDLLAEHGRSPLRICGAPSCGMFFIGRRRWCCAACGNRARAARHYEGRKARTATPASVTTD